MLFFPVHMNKSGFGIQVIGITAYGFENVEVYTRFKPVSRCCHSIPGYNRSFTFINQYSGTAENLNP